MPSGVNYSIGISAVASHKFYLYSLCEELG